MQRSLALVAACFVGLLGASSASAGTLASETLTMMVPLTQPVDNRQGPLAGSGDTGTSTATSATLAAGSGFSTVTFDLILPSASPLTIAHVQLGNHGAIHITPAGATATAPQTGKVAYQRFGKTTYFTVPIAAGAVGTLTRVQQIPFVGTVLVTLVGTGWHTGQVKATGLTTGGTLGASLPDVTATGSFDLTSRGGGSITLVTLARVRTSGLDVRSTASPMALRLSFLPEPGSLLLLGAGATGLLAAGWRRRKS